MAISDAEFNNILNNISVPDGLIIEIGDKKLKEPLGLGKTHPRRNHRFSTKILADYLKEMSVGPIAEMFINGPDAKINEASIKALNGAKTMEEKLDVLEDYIVKSLIVKIKAQRDLKAYKALYSTLEGMTEYGISNSTIEEKLGGSSSGRFGTFLEDVLFGNPGSGNDPRADIQDIAVEVKSTYNSDMSNTTVGNISGAPWKGVLQKKYSTQGIDSLISRAAEEASFLAEYDNVDTFLSAITLATYKIVLKMNNFLMLHVRQERRTLGSTPYLNFREISLYLSIIVKKVWEDVSREFYRQVKGEATTETSKYVQINIKANPYGEIMLNIKFKTTETGGEKDDKGKGTPTHWEDLYRRKLDLLSMSRTSASDFRAAVFGTVRAEQNWFEGDKWGK